MSTIYPAQIDNSISLPPVNDNITTISAESVNILRQSIIAIETELGVKPSGSYTNVRTRLDFLTTGGGTSIQLAGDLGNNINLPYVVGLQGRPLSGIAPTSGQILLWNGLAWVPSNPTNTPGGINRSVQFNNSNVLDGASNTTISTDGYLEIGANRTGGASTIGDVRFGKNASVYVKVETARELPIWKAIYLPAGAYPQQDALYIGTDGTNTNRFDYILAQSKYSFGYQSLAGQTFFGAYGENFLPSALNSSGFYAGPNIWLSRPDVVFSSLSDPFNGGKGILRIDSVITNTTSTPVGGSLFRVNSSNYHFETLLPGDNPLTGWRDLVSSSAGAGGDGYSIQYNLNGGLGGAGNVHVSVDGFLQVGKNKIGGVADLGDIRLAKDFSIYSRDKFETKNVPIMRLLRGTGVDGYQDNWLKIGNNATSTNILNTDAITIASRQITVINVANTDLNPIQAGINIVANNFAPTSFAGFGNYLYPNMALITEPSASAYGSDLFNGAQGIFLLRDLAVGPSASPSNGFYLWSDPSTHHPKVRLPNGSIYDLISTGSGTPLGADRSVQFNNAGSFDGAIYASISFDGYLQVGNAVINTPAQTGDLRLINGGTIKFRNNDNNGDIAGLTSIIGIPNGNYRNTLSVGGSSSSSINSNWYDGVQVVGNLQSFIGAKGLVWSGQYTSGVSAFATRTFANSTTSPGVSIWPNLSINRISTVPTSSSLNQPFRDGYGILNVGDVLTVPTIAPTNSFDLWSDSTTHEPTIKLPNGTTKSLVPQGLSSSIQYKDPTTGGLAGSSQAIINSDGNIKLKADAGIKVFDHLGTEKNLIATSSYDKTDGTGTPFIADYAYIGDFNSNNILDEIYNRSNNYWDAMLDGYFDGGFQQGIALARVNVDGSTPSVFNPDPQAVFLVTNLVNTIFFNGAPNDLSLRIYDGYGKGVIYIGAAAINPTTNPYGGSILYVDNSNNHPTVRLPNGEVHDLISSGGAVIFDGGATSQNARTDRAANQSPIDNTKEGIINFSSDTSGITTGATGDYSTLGGGDQNQASGNYSTICGGTSNTATANGATVCGGSSNRAQGSSSTAIGGNCHADGDFSVALGSANHATGYASSVAGGEGCVSAGDLSYSHGTGAQAPRPGQYSHSLNLNSSTLGIQYCRIPIYGTSASGAPVNLVNPWDGNELDMRNLITPADGMHYSINVRVVMGNRTANKTAAFVHELVATWDGSTFTIPVDTPVVPDATGANGTGWTVAISATGGTSLRVQCTGGAGDPIVDCTAIISWAEVGA